MAFTIIVPCIACNRSIVFTLSVPLCPSRANMGELCWPQVRRLATVMAVAQHLVCEAESILVLTWIHSQEPGGCVNSRAEME